MFHFVMALNKMLQFIMINHSLQQHWKIQTYLQISQLI